MTEKTNEKIFWRIIVPLALLSIVPLGGLLWWVIDRSQPIKVEAGPGPGYKSSDGGPDLQVELENPRQQDIRVVAAEFVVKKRTLSDPVMGAIPTFEVVFEQQHRTNTGYKKYLSDVHIAALSLANIIPDIRDVTLQGYYVEGDFILSYGSREHPETHTMPYAFYVPKPPSP